MILNYFFIGFVFTFLAEMLYQKFYDHPLLRKQSWGSLERLICVLIWPAGLIVFLVAFIGAYFKK